jgi:hypothetical protein
MEARGISFPETRPVIFQRGTRQMILKAYQPSIDFSV